MAGGVALVLVLALLAFTALTVWIVCLCSPRITAKRFFSDVYTCQLVDEHSGATVPGSCVVRWSLTERMVTMTLDLALVCADDKEHVLLLDLMLPPAKASPRYLSGFGMSRSGARCFVEPVKDKEKSGSPKARLRLLGIPAKGSEEFTIVAQMMV